MIGSGLDERGDAMLHANSASWAKRSTRFSQSTTYGPLDGIRKESSHNLVGEATRVVSTIGAADEITGVIVEVSEATTEAEDNSRNITKKNNERGGDPTSSSKNR
ncbi:hypothetical protein Tco_1033135 [Tanacetum coccineum]|uniref:Uncharacterized protein n=1 Tax=Tanacetum coccineum TaxID=301880 RepID=A0ABQ5GFG8_9ASTR